MSLPTQSCLRHSQNFLHDSRLVDALLDRSSIGPRDLVYEIGPGTGMITRRLAGRCRRVVAIEKDARLAAALRRRFAACPHVTIHAADFLRFPLPAAPYKVFANIPYAITTAIVSRLTTTGTAPLDSYLVVQREAADRYIGTPRGTLYAALLYPWFVAGIVHRFQPGDFRPVPRVESVLLRLHRRPRPLIAPTETQSFRDFVIAAYTAPRPTLRGSLSACLGRGPADHLVRAAALDPRATPSLVPGALWVLLFEHLKDAGGPSALRGLAGAEQQLRREQGRLRKRHRTRLGAQCCYTTEGSHAPDASR